MTPLHVSHVYTKLAQRAPENSMYNLKKTRKICQTCKRHVEQTKVMPNVIQLQKNKVCCIYVGMSIGLGSSQPKSNSSQI